MALNVLLALYMYVVYSGGVHYTVLILQSTLALCVVHVHAPFKLADILNNHCSVLVLY